MHDDSEHGVHLGALENSSIDTAIADFFIVWGQHYQPNYHPLGLETFNV
jgi:hypothetical protein